jgi:hypothetical protein
MVEDVKPGDAGALADAIAELNAFRNVSEHVVTPFVRPNMCPTAQGS